MASTTEILNKYDLSAKFGFAREFPLSRLPAYFQPWHAICDNLQELFKARKIRDEVQKLPQLDQNQLSNEKEWDLAYVLLAYIAQGYVWQDGADGIPKALPPNVAVPFTAVASHLGVNPCFTMLAFALANWTLADSSKPIDHGNLKTIVTLRAGKDEEWFFNTVQLIEFAFGPAVPALIEAQAAVKAGNVAGVIENLGKILAAQKNMYAQLKRMNDGLDPTIFFTVVRPNLNGWNNEAFKKKGYNGLIYEGVNSKPVSHIAGTAAQSSVLQTFDAAFGIKLEQNNTEITNTFRKYMPIKHQKFIELVENGPSIREFVTAKGNQQLTDSFNKCLEEMNEFRNYHVNLIAKNIVTPSRQAGHPEEPDEVKGAFGIRIMPFVKDLKNATGKAVIS